jgi:hypothetical protein
MIWEELDQESCATLINASDKKSWEHTVGQGIISQVVCRAVQEDEPAREYVSAKRRGFAMK